MAPGWRTDLAGREVNCIACREGMVMTNPAVGTDIGYNMAPREVRLG